MMSNPVESGNTARLPDFICPGSQRCGTTWVHTVFSSLDTIHVPICKETRFWDSNASGCSLGAYRNNFVCNTNVLCGELCPSYMLMRKNEVEQIARHVPNLRVFFLFRDPVERTLSQIRMFGLAKQRKHGDVYWILRFIERYAGDCFNDYTRAWKIWTSVFGLGNVRILLYDRLTDQPRDSIVSLLEFLGADECYVSDEVLHRRVSESRRANSGNREITKLLRGYVAWRMRARIVEFAEQVCADADHWAHDNESHLERLSTIEHCILRLILVSAKSSTRPVLSSVDCWRRYQNYKRLLDLAS